MDDHKELLLRHRIKPEGAAYVSADDRLVFSAWNTVTSLVVQFAGYALNPQGETIYFQFQLNPTNDRVITSRTEFMGEVFILSLTAHISSGNANRGQCYVRVQVQRGTGTPAVPLARLIQGYLTDNFSPSFPYGKQEGPLEGQGMIRSIAGTNPAAGAEISEAVPTGARWRLLLARYTLVTSASVANRKPEIGIDDGTTVLAKFPPDGAFAANTTNTFTVSSLANGSYTQSTDSTVFIPSNIIMAAGWHWATITTDLQAGDNYSAPQFSVEEWLEA